MTQDSASSKVLICIPFAGGSSFAYSDWQGQMSPEWRVRAVELPGHGTLADRSCLTQISDMVDAVIEQIESVLLSENYYLFGHSLGALLAYEVALRLDEIGFPIPHGIFASAASPPHKLTLRQRHKKPDDEFLDHLRNLGGIPAELLEQPTVRQFILNVLRSDFTALETHAWKVRGKVDCPLYVIYSNDDNMVEIKNLPDWADCATTAPYFLDVGSRGHMYLEIARNEILEFIQARGREALV